MEREENATEFGDILLHHQAFLFLPTGLPLLSVDYFFIIIYNAYKN